VAARAADLVLLEDSVSLKDLVLESLTSNKDIRYIFVLDGRGNVLAHTFGHFLPPDLQPANSGSEFAGGFRIRRLASEEGLLRDMAVPIFQGRAGVVRVGMSEERLERTLTRTIQQLLLLVATVSLLGVLAAYLPTRILTRPLLELGNLARAVGRADFTPRARVRFGDEIGQLAAAFNAMVENLEQADAERSRLLDDLRSKEQMRLQLLDKIISAQEDERKRVARELHDETSQSLTSLIIGLKVLESVAILPEVREKAAELRALGGEILRDVHDLAFQLRPSLLDHLGMVAAIQRLAEDYTQKAGLHIDLQVSGFEDRRLPAATETALYRLVQEALTNVAKHAGAKNVSVILQEEGAAVLAIVEDDGKGFNVAEVMGSAAKEKKLGLFGMEERAALVGGRLTIESIPGKGTRVSVEVPFEQ
jgi:signal transduction histidine kinase